MILYRIERTIEGNHLDNYVHEYRIQYRRWWFPFWKTLNRPYSSLNEAFKQISALEGLEKKVKTKRVSYIYKEGDK